MEQPQIQEPKLLTVRETMKITRSGRDAVYRWIETGQLRAVRTGRNIRVPVDAIDEFIANLPPASKRDGDSQAA